MFKFKKIGFLKRSELGEITGWRTHIMAPTVRQKPNGMFEVYCGGWNENRISKIYRFEVEIGNEIVFSADSAELALDVGSEGCFDENGVFPAHLSWYGEHEILFYSGFQRAVNAINHLSFGGGCYLDSGRPLTRIQDSPILAKSPEGSLVRAGQSSLLHKGVTYTVYSAGTSSQVVGGKNRPEYDIYLQVGVDPLKPSPIGRALIKRNRSLEHGLGRPQLVQFGNDLLVFFTRRTLDMKYVFGYAYVCEKKMTVNKYTPCLDDVERDRGLDDEMIYFPSIVKCKKSGRTLLFYSGNNFGERGMGVLEVTCV